MTADEAKKELEQNMKLPFGCNVSKETSRMAIQAIETVQKLSERKMTIDALENYMQFEDECVEKGFTLKSVIEARDKQIAKKIEVFNGQATCPNCKYIFGGIDVIKNLIMWHMPYCKDCGQKLDWSDEDER